MFLCRWRKEKKYDKDTKQDFIPWEKQIPFMMMFIQEVMLLCAYLTEVLTRYKSIL